MSIVAAALVVVLLAALAALVGSSSSRASTQAQKATYLATLVSDIGKFNDRSFNQSQKEGLVRAQKKLHVKIKALQSNAPSDYIPNLTSAVRAKSNIIISAGFLLAGDTNTVASKYPKIHFAITDYSAKDAPFKGRKNVMGLTYAANESGCLVGVLAAKMAKKMGRKIDRCGRRHQDPAGRHLDRRLPVLREEGRPRDAGPGRLLAGLRRGGQVQDAR